MQYITVQACAVDIICSEGDKLSNREIADKVSRIMHSKTTHKSIAWYKNKINRGIIKLDKTACKWQPKGKTLDIEVIAEVIEKVVLENEAEHYVFVSETKRNGKAPVRAKSSSGYDYDSGDRHIEVKGKKKKGKTTWIQLTANETETLIKDRKYYLYLVEGNFEKVEEGINLFMIPQQDLLAMTQMKIHARLTQLSNRQKRQTWIDKNL